MSGVNWLVLAIGAPLALALTVGVRAFGRRVNWLDRPGPDRLHTRPVPRLGGVAMFLAFVVAVVVAVRPLDLTVVGLLAGGGAVVAVMLIDDVRGLRPRDKFLAQVVAAAIPVATGTRIDAVSNPFGGVFELPIALVVPFTLFWIVGMMAAVNFADGVDGLAAGVAAVAGVVLVVLSDRLGLPEVATLGLAITAVTLGFLPLNAFRSTIIMGDTGSNFLGFAIAVVAIMGPAKIATALLVLGVPILEVAWSIVRRTVRRRAFFGRDALHLHHRLWEAGLAPPAIALMYWALAAALGLIALLVERLNKLYAFGGLALLMVALLVVLARRPRRRHVGQTGAEGSAEDNSGPAKGL